MGYGEIWESVKISLLVTWSVLFSYIITLLLKIMGMTDVIIPFDASSITYFFGALQSSAFAVVYIHRHNWIEHRRMATSFFRQNFKQRG